MKGFVSTLKGKIILACTAVGICAAGVVIFLFMQSMQEEYRSIVVKEYEGTAFVSNDKKKDVAVYENMALFDGDTTSVSENSSVTLELDGDKYMMAEGGTVFTLEASGNPGSDKTVIHMESGAALIRIKNKLNENQFYEVKTPTATISVRGTCFYVRVEKNENGLLITHHQVYGGTTEVTPIDENGNPTEEPEYVSPGDSVGVIEVPPVTENGITSATFIRGEEGNVTEEIDLSVFSDDVIEALLEYLEDGEFMYVTKEELETHLSYYHVHTFGSEWTSDVSGHWHIATCEHTEETAEFATHAFGQGAEMSAPDEEKPGVMRYTCEVCGYYYEEQIPVLEHIHTYAEGWTADRHGHWHAATCVHADITRDFAEHTYGNGIVTDAPTETDEGTMTYICTVCGYEREEDISVLEHTHTYADTWTVNGNGHWHAATCEHDNMTADFVAHSFDSGIQIVAPTELTTGTVRYTCAVCAYSYENAIAALGHTHRFGEEWSYSANGHWYSAICEHSEVTTGFAEHIWDNEHICTVCGYQGVHTYSAWKQNADGITHSHTCVCGNRVTESCQGDPAGCITQAVCIKCNKIFAPATGHSYATNWTYDTNNHWHAAACEHTELIKDSAAHTWDTTHKCTVCGYQGEHTYTAWTQNANGSSHSRSCHCGYVFSENCSGGTATCTDPAVCTRCSSVYAQALGHSYHGTWTFSADGHWHAASCEHVDLTADYAVHTWDNTHKCTVCGYQGTHSFEDWTQNAGTTTHTRRCACGGTETGACAGGTATCTDPAICSSCGEVYQAATGHSYAATWTSDGDNHWHAAICEHSDLTSGTALHTWDTNHKCTVCEYQGTHEYTAWVQNENGSTHSRRCICGNNPEEACNGGTATCTVQAKCADCESFYGELLPHIWIPSNYISAGKCSVCGTVNPDDGSMQDPADSPNLDEYDPNGYVLEVEMTSAADSTTKNSMGYKFSGFGTDHKYKYGAYLDNTAIESAPASGMRMDMSTNTLYIASNYYTSSGPNTYYANIKCQDTYYSVLIYDGTNAVWSGSSGNMINAFISANTQYIVAVRNEYFNNLSSKVITLDELRQSCYETDPYGCFVINVAFEDAATP